MKAYWQKRLVTNGALNDVTNMEYAPRGFVVGTQLHPHHPSSKVRLLDAGKFSEWDVLKTFNRDEANEDYDPGMNFLYLNLNRAATVGVIYYGAATNLPPWLTNWVKAGTVEVDYNKRTYPVFTKSLTMGEHYLKPLAGGGLMYTVILAEAGGKPSSAPWVPTGLPQPQANQPCPAWVHDSYVTGDGYATWHPQIDPIYWCYFQHDHGSDPATFAGGRQPKFNRYAYVAGAHEEHEGFKVLVFEDELYSVMITFHAGSSGYRRLCARTHAFDVVFADTTTREIIGEFAFKGDFGAARAQVRNGQVAALAPLACPENLFVTGTSGSRTVPIYPGPGYESWQLDRVTAKALPLTGGVRLRIDEAITVCSDSRDADDLYTCDELIEVAGRPGVRHWFDLFGGFGMDTTAAGARSGTYCTDYLGAQMRDCSDPAAIEQYAKPNVKAQLPDVRGFVRDPWSMKYVADGFIRTNLNLENALGSPN